jgi:predicted NBD/HSP70 family sugar kinase
MDFRRGKSRQSDRRRPLVHLITTIDVGGSWCDIALYHSHHHLEPDKSARIPMQMVSTEARQAEKDLAYEIDIDNICFAVRSLTGGHVGVISVVVAGSVNEARSQLDSAGNIVHWEGKPIVNRLSSEFQCLVRLGNDGEATALAEAYYHVPVGTRVLSWLWGSGCNGSLVGWNGNKPLSNGPELGHQLLPEGVAIESIDCGCGQRCLESVCGGNKIRLRDGDPELILPERWMEYAQAMAAGLYNSILHYRPEIVSFVGGVINGQPWMLYVIEDWIRPRLRMFEMPEIRLSPCGDSAGTLGALALDRWLHKSGKIHATA